MKKQITHIAPLQTAKVFAALSLLGSLPFLLLMVVPMMLSMAPPEETPVPIGYLVLAPFFYALFGFLFTLVGAWFYNLVAKHLGGIEYTSVEVAE